LDRGEVVEQGTYQELMELNGLFANMARRQIT
jgi:ABC-type multidrug transport system fused ATPase/permease subunit